MGGGDDTTAGGKDRVSWSIGQRADMSVLRGNTQPKKSESLTHSKSFSKRLYRFVVCLLIDWLVGSSMFPLYQTTVCKYVITDTCE